MRKYVATREHDMTYCSFCGRAEKECKWLVSGPMVFICDRCTEEAAKIGKGKEEERGEVMMEVLVWRGQWRPVVSTLDGVVWIGPPCLSRFVAMAELDKMAGAFEAVCDAVQAEAECGPLLH